MLMRQMINHSSRNKRLKRRRVTETVLLLLLEKRRNRDESPRHVAPFHTIFLLLTLLFHSYSLASYIYLFVSIQVPIADVLAAKHSYRWVDPVIADTSTVRAAVSHTIDGGLSGMMVVSAEGRVVGLITSRDLLRSMARGFQEPEEQNVFDRVVSDFMTPIRQVIYARPDETVGMCRAIMAKLGLKCLPILEGNKVKGLITARDMSDFGLKAMDKGGKEAYLNTVSSRVGLSSHTTSMAEPPPFLRTHLALDQAPLFAHVGSFALPHPFKMADGRAGRNSRGT